MKHNYFPLIAILFLAFVLSSCGGEKEQKETPKEKPKQEAPKPKPKEEPKPKPVEKIVEEPKETTHTVQQGEWLYDLSRKYYGNAHDWKKIYEANKTKIEQPDLIYPNQSLVIPE